MRTVLNGLALLMIASLAAGQASEPIREDAVAELVDTVYRFEADGSGVMTQTMRVKVQTPAGQTAFSQLYLVQTEPLEHCSFGFVRTHKPDGRVLSTDTSAVVDVSKARGEAPMQGVSVTGIAPTGLEPGDRLEFRIVRRWDPVAEREFWLEHDRRSVVRVESATVSVDVPAGRAVTLRHDPLAPPRVEIAKGRRIYTWALEGSSAGSTTDPSPLFALSTFADWRAAGRWFATGQPDGAASPTVRAKARELAAGTTAAREKVLAIHRGVSRSIRYVGSPFAARGYRARPPDEVLRTGWGDCKDQHFLLATLLREVGVMATPVLVSTSGELPFPEVPALSQFDHVVTLVDLGGEELWLDTTLDVARPGQLAYMLRGSSGLAVTAGQPALVTVPDDPTPANVCATVIGTVGPNGALDATTTVEFSGEPDLTSRVMVRAAGVVGLNALVNRLAGTEVQGVTVSEPAASDPLDLDKPFEVRFRLRHDTYLAATPRLSSPIPSVLPALMRQQDPADGSRASESQNAAGETRAATSAQSAEDPAERPRPSPEVAIHELVTLTYPQGARLVAPMPVKVATPAGQYEASYEVAGTTLSVSRTYRSPAFASEEESASKTASLRALVIKDAGQLVVMEAWAPAPADGAEKTPEELVRLGAAALSAGRAAEAVELLSAAVARNPDHVDALRMLARAANESARWAEAESSLRRLVELDPLDARSGAFLGMLLTKRAHYPEAIAALRSVVAANPYESQPWVLLGLLCRLTQQPEAAIDALRSAVRVEQTNPATRLVLAGLLQEQGRDEEARRIRDEVAAMPEMRQSTMPLERLDSDIISYVAGFLGIKPGLTPDLRASAGPDDAEEKLAAGLTRLATTSTVDRDFATAADLLEIAEALIVLGRADLAAGRLEPARERLAAALELTLDLATARDLAEASARQGRFNDALRLWSIARRAPGATMPEPLASHLEKSGPKGSALESKLISLRYQALDRRKLTFERPVPVAGCNDGDGKQWVVVRALVGGDGAVTVAEALSGPRACRDYTIASLKARTLPRLVIAGKGIASPRTIVFVFHPGGTIEAQYSYTPDPFGEVADFASRSSR